MCMRGGIPGGRSAGKGAPSKRILLRIFAFQLVGALDDRAIDLEDNCGPSPHSRQRTPHPAASAESRPKLTTKKPRAAAERGTCHGIAAPHGAI
jgi:hypothetical protein